MEHIFRDQVIEDNVGAANFEQGQQYFRGGRVMNIMQEGRNLHARVFGSAGAIYVVNILLDVGGIGNSYCSCPMQSECKHVAALYLAGKSKFVSQNLAPIFSVTPKAPMWASALLKLVDDENEEKTDELIIAFKFREFGGFGNKEPSFELCVRPKLLNAVTGKTTFVGVGWTNYLASAVLSTQQEVYLRRLYGSIMTYHGRQDWIALQKEKVAFFWPVIREHASYNVKLLNNSGKVEQPVRVDPRILKMVLEVSNDGEGVKIQKKFYLGEDGPLPASRYILIGSPAVFALVFDQDLKDFRDKMSQPFSLHGVLMTKNGRDARFFEDIFVPVVDLELFMKKYLPDLSRNFELRNVSTKIKIPQVGVPQLIVRVDAKGKAGIGIGLKWHYEGEEIDFSFESKVAIEHQSSGDIVLRSKDKEKELVTQFISAMRSVPSFISGLDFDGSLNLQKFEAALFLNRVIPGLRNQKNIIIQLIDGLPNFELYEKAPEVQLSVEENKDGSGIDWFDLNIVIDIEGEKISFQEVFEALTKKEEFIFLESGRYVPLASEAFDTLKQLILEADGLADHQKNGLKVSRFHAGLWNDLSKHGVIQKQAERWKQSMDGLLHFKGFEKSVPSKKLKVTLRHYQEEGFLWLKFLRDQQLGGVLGDDMGLGKTIQALALMDHVHSQRKKTEKKKQFLVIAPTSVAENWDMELQKFAPHLKRVIFRRGDRSSHHQNLKDSDVAVISYALLVRDFELLKDVDFDTIILDEAQFVKNYQSKAYSLIRKLKSEVKIALTGTPMENNLMELWSIFSIVSPGLFGNPDHFREHYRNPIEKNDDKFALERLRSRIRPFLLRRKKESVVQDLPPKIEQTIFMEMNAKHRKVYDLHLQRERKKVLGLLNDGGLKSNRFAVLAALTKMRQMCLYPGLVDPDYSTIPSTKLEALEEHLETLVAEGRKVLIFSQFTKFLGQVRFMLDKMKAKYLYLDGGTKNRMSLIQNFQSETGPPIFLISIKAGGFGLNLTAADYCILLDPWWNPAVESQAIDRTHRIGQHKQVFVYRMILKDSIEEKVLKLQDRKRQLFKNILEDGDKFGSLITEDDIRGIFE